MFDFKFQKRPSENLTNDPGAGFLPSSSLKPKILSGVVSGLLSATIFWTPPLKGDGRGSLKPLSLASEEVKNQPLLSVNKVNMDVSPTGIATFDEFRHPLKRQSKPVPLRSIFAPVGFDDNDLVQITVEGILPSGCYTNPWVVATVDKHHSSIKVEAFADYEEKPCTEALIPFDLVLNLGVLKAGEYSVDTGEKTPKDSLTTAFEWPRLEGYIDRDFGDLDSENHLQSTRVLKIKKALSSTVDDFEYASINRVYIKYSPLLAPSLHQGLAMAPSKNDDIITVVLEGQLTNECQRWKTIEVTYHGSTVNILPILDRVALDPSKDSDKTLCRPTAIPFRKMIPLTKPLEMGRYLLHIRSENGQAFNQLFYSKPYEK